MNAPTCVADLSTDAAHCGRCNRGCLGGTCEGGKCGLVRVASATTAAGGSLAVVGDTLYFALKSSSIGPASNGWIRKVSTQGGESVVVASSTNPAALVGFAGHLYWTDAGTQDKANGYLHRADGSIRRLATATGAITTIVRSQVHPSGIAVSNMGLAWSNIGPETSVGPIQVNNASITYYVVVQGSVWRADLSGSNPVALASGLSNVGPVAIDGARVIAATRGTKASSVTSGGLIFRDNGDGLILGFANGTSTTIANKQSSPIALAAAGGATQWTNQGICSYGGAGGLTCQGPSINLIDGAGARRVVATTNAESATDGAEVFWYDGTALKRAPVSGGTAITMVVLPRVERIVVDARGVYLRTLGTATESGALFKIAK